MERQLTEGRPFGVLLRYALPVLGGNLFQLFYTLADTVIVGKALGADALAAVGSTGIISYFVLCFVQGLTGGFGICLGQCCGAGDETGHAPERCGVVDALGGIYAASHAGSCACSPGRCSAGCRRRRTSSPTPMPISS